MLSFLDFNSGVRKHFRQVYDSGAFFQNEEFKALSGLKYIYKFFHLQANKLIWFSINFLYGFLKSFVNSWLLVNFKMVKKYI
jgi:hypothetical protein